MKPKHRTECQCGEQKQAGSNGWTKKRKRKSGLRFSSSKAQRRAKQSVLQENSGVEFSNTTRTFEHQPGCPLIQNAGEVSSETRTSKQDRENRVGIPESCTLVNQGGLSKVQEGSTEG